MKVLFIIDSLSIGGAERVVINLAQYFKKKGDEPIIITLRPENHFSRELGDIRVYCLNKKHRIDIAFFFQLKKLIKELAPDIINAHLFTSALWTRAAITGMKKAPPVFVTYHNVLWNEKWYTPLHKAANKFLHKKTKEHIFVSEDVRSFYRKAEGLEGKVIYNGIDTDKYSFTSDEKSGKKLLFVGRLIERKGVKDLFEIFKRLPEEYSLTICGVGPMEKFVREKTGARIAFFSTQETARLYHEHDMLLLPSYWEGFALVVLEAISSGLPVTAYHAPGLIDHPLKEFISFVEVGDIEGFVENILCFGYNKELAEKGRELISRDFSIAAMGKNYRELFIYKC